MIYISGFRDIITGIPQELLFGPNFFLLFLTFCFRTLLNTLTTSSYTRLVVVTCRVLQWRLKLNEAKCGTIGFPRRGYDFEVCYLTVRQDGKVHSTEPTNYLPANQFLLYNRFEWASMLSVIISNVLQNKYMYYIFKLIEFYKITKHVMTCECIIEQI